MRGGGGQCIYLTENSYFHQLTRHFLGVGVLKSHGTEDDSFIHRETNVQGTHFGIVNFVNYYV